MTTPEERETEIIDAKLAESGGSSSHVRTRTSSTESSWIPTHSLKTENEE